MSGYGSFYQPYLHMERMLSECATFQTITGSANATEAKTRIKFITVQDYDPTKPKAQIYIAIPCPRVVIWNMNPSKRRSSSSGYSCEPRLLLSLDIEIPSNVGPTEDEQFRYCGPLYESIEDEVALSGMQPGNLYIMEMNYLMVPSPEDPKLHGGRRIWAADLEVVCQG